MIFGFVLARGHNATRQHLPEDQEKILAVVAGAGEGIVTFDEYGKIQTINEGAEAIFFCKHQR